MTTLDKRKPIRSDQQDSPVEETAEETGKVPGRIEESEQRPVRLKRQLGLSHGIGIVAGLVIGGGIYITPRGVILYAGSPGLSIVLWGVGGVLSMLGALTYAEMGITFPVTGEKYVYLDKMYGGFVAFLYIWKYLFLIRGGGNAIKCMMFGRYVLKPFYPDCEIPDLAISLMASVIAFVATAVNCISTKLSARSQTGMTVISALSLSMIVLSGLVWILDDNTEDINLTFEGSATNIGDLILAIHSTVYAYYGWTALNFLIEELKDPERNLPLSIVISIIVTTILYVLVNLTYLAVIGPQGILTSQAVAISVTMKTLGPMAWIMPILISITACASFNSGMLVGSRLSFAGAKRGHLPKVLSFISIRWLTPITSLLLQLVLVLAFIWTVELYTLINNLVFGLLAFDTLCVVGYIRLRLKETVTRKFRLPLIIPTSYLILVTVLVAVPLIMKPMESATGMAIALGTAIPYYVLVIMWTNKPKSMNIDRLTVFLQKLLLCSAEDPVEDPVEDPAEDPAEDPPSNGEKDITNNTTSKADANTTEVSRI